MIRAQVWVVAGLSALVSAVWVGAGRGWGAVALAAAGLLVLLAGVAAALGQGGRGGPG